MRLLDCQMGLFEPNSKAFLSNKENPGRRKHYSKGFKCYSCGGKNYKSSSCTAKPKDKDKEKANTSKRANTAGAKAFICFSNTSKYNDWYLDSGASNHMTRSLTPNQELLYEQQKSHINQVYAANK